MQQREQLGLIFQVGARRIAERIARSLILLMEQIANVRRVLARDAQFLAHCFVKIFRQRFRRFHAEPVKIEVPRVLPALKQALCFLGSFRSDRDK